MSILIAVAVTLFIVGMILVLVSTLGPDWLMLYGLMMVAISLASILVPGVVVFLVSVWSWALGGGA